ncbi:class I SAM-dependent methyltransferase [Candidatus Nitrosarchaeum limnium]|uniref:Methyltransferase domain protein n=1 Tax=Candidatus Nitrosarchaeum limnium BG20 TaxID=859192 RepID=S2E0J2_9ARCH|nr:class I SAM-dependent methyltransferase [Candidatus Nitrosarchaeum limnium]EPA04448.1 methyltransferase domain protein [Candidatus Nitrosarchaeum limnium BG20]
MKLINPLDVFFWTIRKNERDVIKLYNSLSPIMQLATGGTMLNFGYWMENTNDPLSAQKNLCSYFGKLAELEKAKNLVDVGSGLSAPAIFWRDKYEKLDLFCININYDQLSFSGPQKNIHFFNSTSTKLPFADNSVDRVLALESSQHFKPLKDFILESKRILKSNGILTLAIPVTMQNASIMKLGILKFTWSSEHYELEFVKKLVGSIGFKINDEKLIGKEVYVPLANYYIKNRDEIKKLILKKYSKFVEQILFTSMLKMKKASEKNTIEYVVLKCSL